MPLIFYQEFYSFYPYTYTFIGLFLLFVCLYFFFPKQTTLLITLQFSSKNLKFYNESTKGLFLYPLLARWFYLVVLAFIVVSFWSDYRFFYRNAIYDLIVVTLICGVYQFIQEKSLSFLAWLFDFYDFAYSVNTQKRFTRIFLINFCMPFLLVGHFVFKFSESYLLFFRLLICFFLVSRYIYLIYLNKDGVLNKLFYFILYFCIFEIGPFVFLFDKWN